MNGFKKCGTAGAAALFSLMASASLQAAYILPAWSGEQRTTSATFDFTTSSETASPETSSNPYGNPSLLVENEMTYGAGWMDPANAFHLTRGLGSGAWDLGKNGKLSIMIPIADSGNSLPKNVDFVLDLVWYQGPMGMPGYSINGLAPAITDSFQELVELDAAGSWQRTIWTASFENITADTITLEIFAPSNGAVIDSVGLRTRFSVIPEPGSVLLVGIAVMGSATLRRRKLA